MAMTKIKMVIMAIKNGDDQDHGDEMAEKVEKIKAEVSGLKDSSQALQADFNTAVAAGCGDNLAGFNQNVVDLVTRLGEAQEALIALGGELETVDLANVSDEDQAIVTSDLSELEAAILASSAQNAQLAELSNTCNAAG